MENKNSVDVSSLYLCEINRCTINQELRKLLRKSGKSAMVAIVIAFIVWATPILCVGIGAASEHEKNINQNDKEIFSPAETTTETTTTVTTVVTPKKQGKKNIVKAVSMTPFETTVATTEETTAMTTNIIETTIEEVIPEPVIQVEPMVMYNEPQIVVEPEIRNDPPVVEQAFETITTTIPETEPIELPETDPVCSEPVIESETEIETEPIVDSVWYDENNKPVSENDFILLCNIVAHEYGSDYVPVAEKAKVVDVVMTRSREGWADGTIYGVLAQPYQFSGFSPSYEYSWRVTSSCKEAVYYYFNHEDEFAKNLYFYGDGYWNYFHR